MKERPRRFGEVYIKGRVMSLSDKEYHEELAKNRRMRLRIQEAAERIKKNENP